MDNKLLIERRDRIAVVTLNDPATRNALSSGIVGPLTSFLMEANRDKGLGCIVLTGGSNGYFCSGGNIKDMLEGSDPMFAGTPFEMQEGYRNGIQAMTKLFYDLDVPVVAAVDGPAVGAGCDLACMCDIRIASNRAQFAESFLRVGLVSGDGGAWWLPRIVGLPRAMEMALTCRQVGAAEAKEWGLATQLAEPEALMDAALKTAGTIAALPPLSVRLNKRLIRRSLDMTLAECLEWSASCQAIVQNTADQKEAVAALLEKRPPIYQGR